MEIKITCDTKLSVALENLLPFQGELKTLSEVNYQKLKKQILEEGFCAPVFVWKDAGKYYLLDGHQRTLTCAQMKKEGYKIPDLPAVEIFAKTKLEAKKKLLSYVSQFGKVDSQGLYEYIIEAEIPIEDMADFEIPEIDMDEFKAEYFAEEAPAGDGSEDNVPEIAQNELGVKLGDIYQLGEHRLMCGDSTDLATVEKLMNGEKADMVFTDPPYGMDLDTDYSKMPVSPTGAKPIKHKRISGDAEDFDSRFISTSQDLFHYCDNMVFFGADYYSEHIRDRDLGSWYVWDKRVTENFDKMIGSAFELAWSKKRRKREICRCNNTLYSGESDAINKVHPTQKPIKLIEWFFERMNGKLVVDLFLGSGSTLIACEKTNRKCYGMELDPHYCSVIIKRWEEYTGLKHKKL
jgi:DNA modification methylase